MRYIDPVSDLGPFLLDVEKPGRYTGGEFGILAKKDKDFNAAIAFPDLYEIGMGNQALRIIYNRMNNISGVSCDRAFAPAPDFEKLLREKNIPLYGLDTGVNLADLDLLMFTLGYELGLNGILTMLDVCGIPLHCKDRNKNHPIIIAGGPAVSNPHPFSAFIDAFWIGEAEAGFFDLVSELVKFKNEGKGRSELLNILSEHPNIWVKDKKNAKRAIMKNFCDDDFSSCVYPIPSMKIVQHHGSVEIMRGCPNGCRFCHAGFWYRPARQKNAQKIINEVHEMVTKGGWQEISLSSLSSGDYDGIDTLIDNLNNQFKDKHVSFQLPSLKVSSFALSILEKISVTRKSGLTFAVETPLEIWQLFINKEVSGDSVIAIIEEARKSGWKGAKFYFMIGLPNKASLGTECDKQEDEEIVKFISDIGKKTRMHFNINVGIFIPKPYTPYQNVPQINSEDAERKLNYIKSKLKPLGHKISVSDSLISRIEGLLSRGDERSGFLCEEAWKSGSRLDPWSEYINRNKWLDILQENKDYIDSIYSGKMEPLPWAQINSCISDEFIKKESAKTDKTPSCKIRCSNCGVCDTSTRIDNSSRLVNSIFVNQENDKVNENELNKCDPDVYRVIFKFNKEGSAVFHGHLSLIEMFSMAFRRACIPVNYTQGFNPLAKMEFASPLTTGISAFCEYASVDFSKEINTDVFKEKINMALPCGISIKQAECFYIKSGQKKHSLASLLWGFSYEGKEGIDYVSAKHEKTYRQSRLDELNSLFYLKRKEILARNIINENGEWASYFDVFNHLYGSW